MTDEPAAPLSIHIHEDEVGMRCLRPLVAAGEVADDVRAADAASEANRARDGVGWTDVHTIAPPEHDYDPYGTYEDEAYCYGLDATCFLKLEADGSLVRQVWFHVETPDAERLAQLREAIVALDQLVPSIVADYWLHCTGIVRDRDFLDRYVRALSNGD